MKKWYQSEVESDGTVWKVDAATDEGQVTAEVIGASKTEGTIGLEIRIDGGEAHLRMLEGIVAELMTSLLGAPRSRSMTSFRLATIRQGLPRAYMPWTEADETLLLERWDAGDPVPTIAEQLERGAGGVRSRLIRLGRIKEAS
jgi:hypothetical protein